LKRKFQILNSERYHSEVSRLLRHLKAADKHLINLPKERMVSLSAVAVTAQKPEAAFVASTVKTFQLASILTNPFVTITPLLIKLTALNSSARITGTNFDLPNFNSIQTLVLVTQNQLSTYTSPKSYGLSKFNHSNL
jgi:hypothetical protein